MRAYVRICVYLHRGILKREIVCSSFRYWNPLLALSHLYHSASASFCGCVEVRVLTGSKKCRLYQIECSVDVIKNFVLAILSHSGIVASLKKHQDTK